MRRAAVLLILALAAPAAAQDWLGANVLFLGERHGSPEHHARQAAIVGDAAPAALVFEMLTPDQAARVTPDLIADPDAMATALDWAESGWPDFALYHPIFAAAPSAAIYGAGVPRAAAFAVAERGAAAVFSGDAARFGLDAPLPAAQQATREVLQAEAHCNAMPQDMLPMMVAVQRLRDATLAAVAETALRETGGPVVVITGNGHARTDWGAPAALARAAPDIASWSLGQLERDDPAIGPFDAVEITDPVDRPDPCAALR